ncbi:MAG: BMC domain-containing protein [Oligoflexia bacterium]|nr:BMC domain-containing protein [Oligoflexia bacterium]
MFQNPAVAVLELKSIARGFRVADTMVKKAHVELVKVHPICPGKFIIMIMGEVDPVDEAMHAGIVDAGDLLVAEMFLPYAHRGIIPALTGSVFNVEWQSVAIVESFSVACAFKALDISLKRSAVQAIDMRLANGLGGKAYYILNGSLDQIQSATEIATTFLQEEGALVITEIIAAPHAEFLLKGINGPLSY